jgi:hypothetical protein
VAVAARASLDQEKRARFVAHVFANLKLKAAGFRDVDVEKACAAGLRRYQQQVRGETWR